jgi:hypothetical protein
MLNANIAISIRNHALPFASDQILTRGAPQWRAMFDLNQSAVPSLLLKRLTISSVAALWFMV